jgi:hypothetical protein
VTAGDEERFLRIVTADPTVRAILTRAAELGLDDWWLTAGVLFQTVWNNLTGRPVGTGIRDADLFYFDQDTSWDAEDAVIRAGAELFADLPVPVEIRNEARVHRSSTRRRPSAGRRAGPNSPSCPGSSCSPDRLRCPSTGHSGVPNGWCGDNGRPRRRAT